MLHLSTINTATLELLNSLMKIPEFKKLRLVGGTALALQICHRTSIDIDLFGKMNTDAFELNSILKSVGKVVPLKKSKNIFIYLINDIKVEILNYPYPWIEDEVLEGEVRLAGKKDIAAMKLSAITGRGYKKDFIDLYFLLKEYSLKTMLGFYNQKYRDGSEFLVLKSLTYFEDAEKNEMPLMIRKVNWTEVKDSIIKSVNSYLKTKGLLKNNFRFL